MYSLDFYTDVDAQEIAEQMDILNFQLKFEPSQTCDSVSDIEIYQTQLDIKRIQELCKQLGYTDLTQGFKQQFNDLEKEFFEYINHDDDGEWTDYEQTQTIKDIYNEIAKLRQELEAEAS